jgi:hypothetical protein
MAFVSFVAAYGFPWFPGMTNWQHGGRVSHPLVPLIVLVLIVALVARTFRSKPS